MEWASALQEDPEGAVLMVRTSKAPIKALDPEDSDSERAPSVVALLEDRLYDCQAKTEKGKFFIPEGILENILNHDTVRPALASSLPALAENGITRYTREVCRQEPSFRKIFAILVLSDMIKSIVRFVDLGIDDSYLPMPDPRPFGSHDSRRSTSPFTIEMNGEHRIEWDRVFKRRRSRSLNFFRSQWIVLSPVFLSINEIKHFSFSSDRILPFLDKKSRASTDSKSEAEIMNLGQARYGGYSEVRRIKIHPAHYNFGDYGVSRAVRRLAGQSFS
jgi:hypothetical protein